MLDNPHQPASQDRSCCKEGEAFRAVENHVARGGALGDAEDDGSEERENDRCAEV